jgi:hypothetical protein
MSAANERDVRPFQGRVVVRLSAPQGVALGWRVRGPSGRHPGYSTPELAFENPPQPFRVMYAHSANALSSHITARR